MRPVRRRVAAHVWSVRHAHVDPELSGSLKSQGFRRQCEGFCQARAPFAASHPVSRIASKVVSYSQLGGQGSAHLSSALLFFFFTLYCGSGVFFWVFSLFSEIGRLPDPKSEIGHSFSRFQNFQ